MIAFWVTAALAVPWAAGIVVIRLLDRGRANPLLQLGAGWLVGQVLMLVPLYTMLRLGTQARAGTVLLLLLIIALVGARRLWGGRREGMPRLERTRRTSRHGAMTILMLLAAASLATKLFIFCLSHAWVTIRGDDAISIWLFKAKVITILGYLPLDPAGDYYLGGSFPQYPLLVSLMAAWTPMVCGEWSEHLATLPWLACYASLACLLVGGLGRWLDSTQALLAAFVPLSLPLLLVHVYRPGYADLILATFLAGSVTYWLLFVQTGAPRDAVVAGVLALAAACLKREGPPVAALATGAMLLTSLSQQGLWTVRGKWVLLFACAAGLVGVVLMVDLSDLLDAVRSLGYHPEAWPAFWRHLFAWSSFHIAAGLTAALLIVVMCSSAAIYRGGALLLAASLTAFIVSAFVLTPQARFAVNDQTPGRLFMQVLPAIWMATIVSLSPLLAGVSPYHATPAAEVHSNRSPAKRGDAV